VIIDKSLKGWKEVEYEVVRDAYDNCITVSRFFFISKKHIVLQCCGSESERIRMFWQDPNSKKKFGFGSRYCYKIKIIRKNQSLNI
jgi:hypothetical protein